MIARRSSIQRLLLAVRAMLTVFALTALVASVGLLVSPAFASAEEACPNAVLRVGPSANLPDCRAYELVTPMVKGDNSNIPDVYGFSDGEHVWYLSGLPLPGAQTGGLESVLSTRTASGWVNTALAPPDGSGEPVGVPNGEAIRAANDSNAIGNVVFDGDFSAAFVDSGFDASPLDQDPEAIDVVRIDIPSGEASLAALPDTGPLLPSYDYDFGEEEKERVAEAGQFIAGVSADASHVLFQTSARLPTAPGTPVDTLDSFFDELYDRTGGHTYLVGVLPNGSLPACGAVLGNGAVSADDYANYVEGAVSPDGSNVVFGTPCEELYLRENDSSTDARTVPLVGSFYAGRSADGSKIFTDGRAEDPHLIGGGGVFEYDVASGETTTINPEGAFVASSADGSRVYYALNGGLYLWEDGASRLIVGAGFSPEIEANDNQNLAAVATPDGSRLLFLDSANLVGYDNYGEDEAYVYDATTGSMTCVSCNPSGAPPTGGTELYTPGFFNNDGMPHYSGGEISPDGSRVFFTTANALVPQDTNGLDDVYEWENGRIYLISSGQGTVGSTFVGASSDGSDVFIKTTDHLAPQDIENSTEIYDARVDGGFPYTPPSSGCDSGQCQGPQTPAPVFGAPASATFVGLGNPPQPAAVPVAKAKRPKPTKHRRKASAGKRGKGAKRRRNGNGGGGR
jgi:hypothetical protein